MVALIVESAGPGATVQDGGRTGALRFGVTPAGPMDWTAFATANLALGNDADATAIEIGPGGIVIDTEAPVTLAFAGGGFAWTRGERALPSAARIRLRPREKLRARAGDWGTFAYCAVPGGLDLPEVMGSRATHTRSQLGGLDGRPLRGGDRLAAIGGDLDLDDVTIVARWLQRSDEPIRVVLGPQDDHFTEDAIATLFGEEFKLTGTADRMAYKLEGPKLTHKKDFNIVSDGIALGAIQVAGDGQPMVLMADRQPTGGYAKIAHVCRADIGRLAQTRPGGILQFVGVGVDQARAALLALEKRIAGTADQLMPLRVPPTAATLMQVNLIGGVTDGAAR